MSRHTGKTGRRRAADVNTDVVIAYETAQGVVEQRVMPLAQNGREFYGWCHRTRRGTAFDVSRIAGAWLVVEGEAAQEAAGRGGRSARGPFDR